MYSPPPPFLSHTHSHTPACAHILQVWLHYENLPAHELADDINRQRGPPPGWIYPSGTWPDELTPAAVELARTSLGIDCALCSPGTVEKGCIGDGTCVCVTGWTGPECSIECEGGFQTPCSNNGLCMQDGSCVCDEGWTGKDCSIECAGGHTSPCSYNGECLFDGSCDCYYGYRGKDCAHMCPGIESMPFTGRRAWECSGRGTCDIYPHQLNDSATCICQQGYAGLDCRLACPGFLEAAGICFQKGVCLANLYHVSENGGLSYLKPNGWPKADKFPRPLGSCVCDSGYRGDACHRRCPGNVPPLNTSSCSGHGECLADATCDCQWGYPAGVDSGWRGAACEIECAGGAGNVCSGHGKCDAVGSCACEEGWRLADCRLECPGGHATPCKGNGLCVANGSCLCDSAFRLSDCSKLCPGGPTVTNICSRHGVCDEMGVCICETGWTGIDCSSLADWVIACLTIMSFLICCTGGCLARYEYYRRLRAKRRARREIREKRQGRVLRVTGKRAVGYKVTDPGEIARAPSS